MTLITRIITKDRTILFADGRITSRRIDKFDVITNTERKLIILPQAIIGISGAAEFGNWSPSSDNSPYSHGKREFRVFNVISDYINDKKIQSFDNEIIVSIGDYLKDCINSAHSGKYFDSRPSDINLFITIKSDNIQNFRLILRKTYHPFICEVLELPSDSNNFIFDLNLNDTIDKHDFLELLDQVSCDLFGTKLNEDIINTMTSQDLLDYGNLLYTKFESQYKNPTVGNLFMHADLRV
jgi:hypothetical protein